jgi:hypothetical protein
MRNNQENSSARSMIEHNCRFKFSERIFLIIALLEEVCLMLRELNCFLKEVFLHWIETLSIGSDNESYSLVQSTSFLPNFPNETTSVANEYSSTPNLIATLKNEVMR